jgi:hypothetical protein
MSQRMRISRGDAPAREAAGPEVTTKFTPEQLRKAAERLMTLLDQDGTLADGDRARRRGITICKPDFDGLTPISGQMDPRTSAAMEAVLAKLAARECAIPTPNHLVMFTQQYFSQLWPLRARPHPTVIRTLPGGISRTTSYFANVN